MKIPMRIPIRGRVFSAHGRFPPEICYIVISAMGFGMMYACVKAVSIYHLPMMEIIASRATICLVLSYLDMQRQGASLWGNHKILLVARGIFGTLSTVGIYYSLTVMPLAEATVIQYLHPIFTAILAVFLLKEGVQLTTVFSVILGLLGLVVIVQPTMAPDIDNSLPFFGLMTALVGALGSAAAYVLIRCLSHREDYSVIVFYFPLVALPVSLVLLGTDFVLPALWPAFLLVMVGVFAQVGQVGLTKAMTHNDAAIVTAYSYVQIIFSAVLGWVFFDEIPLVTTVIGGVLILFGALVNAMGSRTSSVGSEPGESG